MNASPERAASLSRRAARRLRRHAGVVKRRSFAVGRRIVDITVAATDSVSWNLANFRGRTGLFRVETLLGAAQSGSTPVIICLWNRPGRIDDILEQLDSQNMSTEPVRLLLWNNNAADDQHYRERIERFVASGSLESVEYVLSPRNVGGIGRFFLAKRLLTHGYSGSFITLDDDEDITADFVSSLQRTAAPREVAGFWAWNYIDSHWNRTPTSPGELADYVGTGGAISDIEIVRSASFFKGLPRRYAFLEDQWLCGYAQGLGWKIRKADVAITFVLHETNQFPQLAELKDEFRNYLLEHVIPR